MQVPLLHHVPKNYRDTGDSKTSSKPLTTVKQSKETKVMKAKVTQLINTKYIYVMPGTLWIKESLTDHYVLQPVPPPAGLGVGCPLQWYWNPRSVVQDLVHFTVAL